MLCLSRVSEANEVPIISLIWVARRLSDSSKTFKKNRKKWKLFFMTVLELADSFKTMIRPGLTVMLFDGLFIRKYNR